MKTQFIHGKKEIWKFSLIFGPIMAIENLKKHLILPLLVLISLFGYIHAKREPANKKVGAILSGSQNTLYHFTFLASYYKPLKKIWKFFLNFAQIMAIENLKKHLILPLLVLISLFGYIHAKGEPANKKVGAILSGSQNTIYHFYIFG
jgi:uncharacterized protein involved in cysteine biosynthesis